jgi:hypothetical protein
MVEMSDPSRPRGTGGTTPPAGPSTNAAAKPGETDEAKALRERIVELEKANAALAKDKAELTNEVQSKEPKPPFSRNAAGDIFDGDGKKVGKVVEPKKED